MKWKAAKELAIACGLTTDTECIANIELHCLSLFTYDNMDQELTELKEDAIKQGIDYDSLMAEFDKQFEKKLEQARKG